MTDYTITTNFGAKDSLPSGNAGKVIKGSEFTTEFTNIQTAVNTKADTAGDTFTGAVNFSADVAVNTNTLFVDVSENKVGIGTNSPNAKLHVAGSSTFAGNATFDNGTSTTIDVMCDDAGTAQLRLIGSNQGTGRLLVGQAGNYGGGIEYNGDSNPVTSGAGTDYTALFRRSDGTDHWTARNFVNNNNWEFRGNVKSNGDIEATGGLLIGTTSNIAENGGFSVVTGTVNYINVGHTSSVGSGNYYAAFRHGTNTIGTITQNGTTGVNYNTSSDERLKENITDSADAGSKVDAIQIRQYDWKADGTHQDYGVIAQELVEVAPEAVHQPVDEEDMMGVDYSKLVPMLIKEVQSLRSRVAELENV